MKPCLYLILFSWCSPETQHSLTVLSSRSCPCHCLQFYFHFVSVLLHTSWEELSICFHLHLFLLNSWRRPHVCSSNSPARTDTMSNLLFICSTEVLIYKFDSHFHTVPHGPHEFCLQHLHACGEPLILWKACIFYFLQEYILAGGCCSHFQEGPVFVLFHF